ncbi:TadE/TadG family protein [Bradyrhizobium sp. KBS0727]|uniref:TadE/TadG family type IV pilus assembly protein n=1 Tax=unclassified Bradyrhizobium TaxID=2631580 RepID=UPI00110F420C|nr:MULTISPECIES: pilus assembly protein [unclassified Bradyrhizobium]QDW38307.1 TadE/TadG family protein [Bradyrhizobium sp. KBS0725]QDW44910.1 TadE/TadG family protein [Bradyrhizobium sp. KBS0727]
MLDTTIFSRIRAATCRFAGANQGNFAVMFAVAAVPLISFVGAAIDYTRANAARSAMQAALDSTALMLGKDLTDGTITTSQISTKATAYFNALYTNKDAKSVAVSATYTAAAGSGSTILLSGSGSVTTDFMKIAGFPSLGFSTNSTSAWGNVRMRVAMALDNTGSMAQDGKIGALQTAAKSLIDQLSALAKTTGDVYISIIPFAKDVNVGASNYNQYWVDFTTWDTINGKCSNNTYKKQSTCQANGKTWTPANHNTWNGCVWDRDKDSTNPGFDTLNTAPTASNVNTLFPAEQWSACPIALMPLSYNWTNLKALIDTMTPNGNTNQAIGMAWAWQSLAQTAPLNAPAKDPAYTYKDAIILLSDGLNTQDRWYTDAASIDVRQSILCTNAKAASVTVYTIQVNTSSPADPTSTVLQNCASSPDKFFMVTSANQTLSVFNSIGTSLAKLRVAK